MSRLSLREALRVLKSGALIEIRAVAVNVTEARILFGLGVALPFVGERGTETDLGQLRALCGEEERTRNEGICSAAMSFGFHQRLTAATHNPAVGLIMQSFSEAILMSIREAGHEGNSGAAEHRALVDAIERGDTAARQILANHLQRAADAAADRNLANGMTSCHIQSGTSYTNGGVPAVRISQSVSWMASIGLPAAGSQQKGRKWNTLFAWKAVSRSSPEEVMASAPRIAGL